MTALSMAVSDVQRALVALGFDVGPAGVDGDAGPHTVAAVAAFQRAAGLVADGLVGPATERALAAGPRAVRAGAPVEPAWLRLARSDLGLHEARGPASRPAILAFFRDAGFPGIRDDAVAWCAAAVGAWLRRAGIRPSGSLAARSYETWGVGLREPALGCVAVKKRGGSAWQGHVGFAVAADSRSVTLLGGNQADSVSVAAFPRDAFTAFRWPADATPPGAARLPGRLAGAAADPGQS